MLLETAESVVVEARTRGGAVVVHGTWMLTRMAVWGHQSVGAGKPGCWFRYV